MNDSAAFFTVGAFLLAAYAVLNPAAVSDYLGEIAKEAEKTATSVASIEVDTPLIVEETRRTADRAGEIQENTRQLANALPRWIRPTQIDFNRATNYLEQAIETGISGVLVGMTLHNDTGQTFFVESFRVWLDDDLLITRDALIIPPFEYADVIEFVQPKNFSGTVAYCLTASHGRDGTTMYEFRTMRIVVSALEAKTRWFEEEPSPDCP